MDTLSMFVYCQVPGVPDGAIQYCLSVSQQMLVMGDQLFNSNGRSKIMLKQKKSRDTSNATLYNRLSPFLFL